MQYVIFVTILWYFIMTLRLFFTLLFSIRVQYRNSIDIKRIDFVGMTYRIWKCAIMYVCRDAITLHIYKPGLKEVSSEDWGKLCEKMNIYSYPMSSEGEIESTGWDSHSKPLWKLISSGICLPTLIHQKNGTNL